MGRRISDSDPSGKKPCAFCRTMRVVVVFAVMVVMLMSYADKLHWLADIEFTSLFGYLVVAFFFTVLGYRVWDEYGRPKKSLAEVEEKRAQREKQFDELDALEAERAALKSEEAQNVAEDNSNPLLSEHVEAETRTESETSTEPEQLDLLGFSTPKKPD
tara:strand:- start:5768 stop:6244 length:477 start_codon:yes stop_codon:yes gene_type:complete